MTLEQLRTFRVIARLGSFTQAAAALNLTQPAVSSQIGALETALSVKLFDRLGKRIALTPEGRIVLNAAADILHRVDEMRGALADLEGLRTGRLRVGASLVVGVYLLPEIVGRFKKHYPHIDVGLRIERAHRIIDLIMGNELDIGLVGEGSPVTDERLVLRPLMRDELVVITPPRHRLAGHGAIGPGELSREPFIIPARDFATSEVILQRIAAAGLKLPVPLELGNIEAVKKAVEAGLGISIVSRCAVQREIDAGTLKALRVRGVPLNRQFFYCWRKGKEPSNAARAFIDLLNQSVASAAPAPIATRQRAARSGPLAGSAAEVKGERSGARRFVPDGER